LFCAKPPRSWQSGPSGYSEYHHIQIGSGPAKLYQAKMIERYVLLNAADQGIAQDYPAYREKNREKLEQYLSKF